MIDGLDIAALIFGGSSLVAALSWRSVSIAHAKRAERLSAANASLSLAVGIHRADVEQRRAKLAEAGRMGAAATNAAKAAKRQVAREKTLAELPAQHLRPRHEVVSGVALVTEERRARRALGDAHRARG